MTSFEGAAASQRSASARQILRRSVADRERDRVVRRIPTVWPGLLGIPRGNVPWGNTRGKLTDRDAMEIPTPSPQSRLQTASSAARRNYCFCSSNTAASLSGPYFQACSVFQPRRFKYSPSWLMSYLLLRKTRNCRSGSSSFSTSAQYSNV